MKSSTQRVTKTDVERFRQKLESQREEARQFLRQAEEEQKGLEAARPAELGDFCVVTATREYLFERASQQRHRLNRIERALQKIQAGTFGECVSCGAGIQHKRLTGMPWTEYCLGCQNERERMAMLHSPMVQFSRPQRVA